MTLAADCCPQSYFRTLPGAGAETAQRGLDGGKANDRAGAQELGSRNDGCVRRAPNDSDGAGAQEYQNGGQKLKGPEFEMLLIRGREGKCRTCGRRGMGPE